MRSTSGEHYVALDHVRALAAFMVFCWHFLHWNDGFPIPFSYVPAVFPLAVLEEGHTGVAVFMVLSGYLFTKLLDGKDRIDWRAFAANRALRLLPLLVVVMLLAGVQKWAMGEDLSAYLHALATGLVLPTLPNGGWSIAVEMHFYVLLPLLLLASRRSPALLIAFVAAAILLRIGLYGWMGKIKFQAYFTLIGRFDQFVLGMLGWHLRGLVAHWRWRTVLVAVVFFVAYFLFDLDGGWWKKSKSSLWIYFCTIEGIFYAIAIAWYDANAPSATSRFSAFAGRIGQYSYSMYLLHYFVVMYMARFVHEHVMSLSNFYVALAWATAGFLLLLPACHLSYRWIEAPALRWRRAYSKAEGKAPVSAQMLRGA